MRKIFLMTLLIAMMSAATALAADWQPVYVDEHGNEIYFDPATVKVSSRNGDDVVFNATFRTVYSDKGKQVLIDWYRNNSIMPPDIQSLAYDITTTNFKKSGESRDFCIMERKFYARDGRAVGYMDYVNSNPMWEQIVPSSLQEVEYYEALRIVQGKEFYHN